MDSFDDENIGKWVKFGVLRGSPTKDLQDHEIYDPLYEMIVLQRDKRTWHSLRDSLHLTSK